MLFDWIENFIELQMIDQFINSAQIANQTAQLSSIVTTFKWSFSLVTYGLIVFGIFNKLRQHLLKTPSK